MYLLILFLPFLSFLINSTLGRKVGNFGGPILAISLIGTVVVCVAVGYYEVVLHKSPLYIGGLGQ